MSHLLTQILYSKWAISPDFARASHPSIARLLEGAKADWGHPKPQAGQGAIAPGHTSPKRTAYEDMQEHSILVVELKGPMMREDQWCGPEGTESIAGRIRLADQWEKVDAIVLEVNSPGGQVDGTEELASAIASTKKPIYALCHNVASAAYWASCHCDEVWMGARTSMAGSVGVYCSFADVREAWEQAGVKLHEVYARTSPDKNRAFNEALDGDYGAMKDQLDDFDRIFMQAVRERRPSVSEEALKGGMYIAEKAVTLGLADRIGGMEELVAHIRSSHSSPNTIEMSEKKDEKKSGGLLASFQGMFNSDEKVQKLNAEVTQVQQERDKAQSDLAESNKRIQMLEASNKALEEKLAAAQRERDGWKGKAEEYGAQPGALGTDPANSPKPDGQRGNASPEYFDAEAAHNKLLS